MTNIASIKGNNSLKRNQRKMNKSMERLASGFRINRASDDAAGLCISQKMKSQVSGLDQANRNTQDALSMLQVADNGLQEASSVIKRMREMTIQSLNDTLTDKDKEELNLEYVQLKEQLESIREVTEFNTIPTVEEHSSVYQKISGNKVIADDITVAQGLNDHLGIIVDGDLKEINLDAGTYSRDGFIDMLDDKLWEVDKNIIPSFDEENRLTISGEKYSTMKLVGNATSFFYEYHIGNNAGVVFGKSDLSGKLDIQSGKNNKFTFRISGEDYTVNLPPTPTPYYMGNGYNSDELVNIMQEQLDQQNAGVDVYMNGNNIALDPKDRVIDGFAGNMIKLDGITSVLYDNAEYGKITRTQGYSIGRVNITSAITIEEGQNDTIRFYLDGDSSSVKEIT